MSKQHNDPVGDYLEESTSFIGNSAENVYERELCDKGVEAIAIHAQQRRVIEAARYETENGVEYELAKELSKLNDMIACKK